MPRFKDLIADSDGTLIDTTLLIRHGQYEAAATYLRTAHAQITAPSFEVYDAALKRAVGGRTRQTFKATFDLLFDGAFEPDLDQLGAFNV